MSDYDLDDILDDDETPGDLPKVLRKKIKELQKQVTDLNEENVSLKGVERKRSLTENITSMGLNPKIAALVPANLTEDEIGEWLTEYGDVFGQPAGAPSQPVIARNAEDAAAIRQMAIAEQGGSPSGGQDLLTQINNAENMEDIMRALGR